jgi:hypothetical protein
VVGDQGVAWFDWNIRLRDAWISFLEEAMQERTSIPTCARHVSRAIRRLPANCARVPLLLFMILMNSKQRHGALFAARAALARVVAGSSTASVANIEISMAQESETAEIS